MIGMYEWNTYIGTATMCSPAVPFSVVITDIIYHRYVPGTYIVVAVVTLNCYYCCNAAAVLAAAPAAQYIAALLQKERRGNTIIAYGRRTP